ncbi:MAG: hypothetical protein HYU41_10000 [Candidatus Rokubacteria bacterium]|nr:hypothetical protein [Candidatus Rokubacteria bacterium]
MTPRLRTLLVIAAVQLTLASHALAWSGGPMFDVTDIEAKCAVCHSSVGREQLRLEPPAFAAGQIVANRHYKPIEDGTGPYQSMSPADRQKLLADVKKMDENASVTLSMPESVSAGQEVRITVTAKGGNSFIGLALMDSDLRRQGRGIQGDGWFFVGPATISGSDGAVQTKWLDRRGANLKKNINSAVIFDQKADLAANKYASGQAIWTVKAPQQPGTYTVVAVMMYGTEKASTAGAVTTPTGAVLPKGGVFGPSGRLLFSKPVSVTVR